VLSKKFFRKISRRSLNPDAGEYRAMHSHRTDLYLEWYFAFCSVAIVIWVFVVRPSMARRRHQRVAMLEDLFDKGTTETNGSELIRGYYNRPSITGLFFGRPASVSTCRGFTGEILVRVSGHFYRPFEVRPKWAHARLIIQWAVKLATGHPPFLYWIICSLSLPRYFPEVPAWQVVAVVDVFFLTLWFVPFLGSRLSGDGYTPNGKGELSLADSVPLKYLTYLPDRFIPIVERREIRDILAHLSCRFQIDLLKSDGAVVAPTRFREWGLGGSVEARCSYRRKLLNRDAVREILTELSGLCRSIEEVGRQEESLSPVAPESL
jgi:hypothetical protein